MFFRQLFFILNLISLIAIVVAVSDSATPISLKTIRAGASEEPMVAKKKKKKKKEEKEERNIDKFNVARNKKVIKKTLKEKDVARALGDAVRNRATDWVEGDSKFSGVDRTVSSIGLAMGTTSSSLNDGGGIEAAPNSVLAHYFLKSHGGAHGFQTVCSLLSVALGMGAIFLGDKSPLQIVLMKRAFLFAMMKHLAGLIAATGMTAQAISKIGFSAARRRMEKLARDPISQYVFYSALMMIWLSAINLDSGTELFHLLPFIGQHIPTLLLGPVLIREVISCSYVVSDILLLLETSSEGKKVIVWWKSCQSIVNALMSLLITPTLWRNSSASQRQEILAALTSKISLTLEVVTGALLAFDVIMTLWHLIVQTPRRALRPVVQRLLCARSYVNFLKVRHSKMRGLGVEIRGGSAHVPMRILDALCDPLVVGMGIKKQRKIQNIELPTDTSLWTWKEKLVSGFGLND
mmetsp:Transcript_34499/g.38134  ORF Transcript_34499/g.38134 Transcript_34499/m.38134 type:complete len:464 (+) Transcript_34499:103-1494(+)